MDIALLVPKIEKYVASADDDGLEDLQKSFKTFQAAGVVLNDIIPVDKLQACVTKLGHAIHLLPRRLLEWNCLCFLADRQHYGGAADMLAILADGLVCTPLLVHCGKVISNNVCDELRHCFLFLVQFTENCDHRREMVYNIAPLREALFLYLLGRFVGAESEVQTLALSGATSIVILFYSGSRKHDGASLLRDGALPAIKEAALHVLSFGVRSGAQWTMLLFVAINALQYTLDTILEIPTEQLTTLNKEMYELSRNEVFRINVICYDVTTSIEIKQRRHRMELFFVGYGDYLQCVLGPGALRSYLLYKPPRVAGAKPIALLIAEFTLHCGEAWLENYILGSLRRFGAVVPEVAAIQSALPSSPGRVAKDRRCSYPDCGVVGTGLHNNMKKCSRCAKVYYCCRRHQELHWPEHRLTCVKATPLTSDDQSA
jgi:hypothetical protein